MPSVPDPVQPDNAAASILSRYIVNPITIISGITAGVGTILIVIGALAISGRDHTLGIPSTSGSTVTYGRTGYTFLADSAAAIVNTAGWSWTRAVQWFNLPRTLGVCALVLAFSWLVARVVLPNLSRRFPRVARDKSWVGATYGVLAIIAIWNSKSLFDLLQASDLLFREESTLKDLPRRAQDAVTALAARDSGTLTVMYGVNVGLYCALIVAALLVAVVSGPAAHPRSRNAWSARRVLKLSLYVVLATQLLLFPPAYGLCYLTGVLPRCAKLTLRPPLDVSRAIGGRPDKLLKGFIVSDLSSGGDEIRQLAVQAPPKVLVFSRSDVIAIEYLLLDCGPSIFIRSPQDLQERSSELDHVRHDHDQ